MDPVPAPSAGTRELSAVLTRAGLTADALRVGHEVLAGTLDLARRPLLTRTLGGLGPGGLLTALLAFDLPQPATALPPDAVAALDEQQLLVRDGDLVRSTCRLAPVAGLLVASDRADVGPDRVMTPGTTTTQLAWAIPRPPGRRVLDVGTGSGVLGVLAAAQGARAVATDVSARACGFARFTAALAGLPLDVREGSLLEPVRGERFDLVVSQPPYIPRPEAVDRAAWLHGGAAGDELAVELLRGLPGALAPGGQAVLRVDLEPDRCRALPLQERAGLTALDVLLVSWPGSTAEQLAYGYAALQDPPLGARYARGVVAYADHLAARGVEQVRSCLVLVRRRAGGRPVVGDVRTEGALTWEDLVAHAGAWALSDVADAELLRARVRAPDGARLSVEQDLTGDLAVGQVLRYPPDSPRSETVLNESAALLMQLVAGGRGVAALVAAYAAQLGQEPEDVVTDVFGFVRSSLRQGILLVAHEERG